MDYKNNFLRETLKCLKENNLTENDVLYVELAGKNLKDKNHIPYDYANVDELQTSSTRLFREEDDYTLYHISWEDFSDAIKDIWYNEKYTMPPVFDTRMKIVMKNGCYFKRIAYRYTNGTLNEFWRYVKIREIGKLEKYSPDFMYIKYPHNDATMNEYDNAMPIIITNIE